MLAIDDGAECDGVHHSLVGYSITAANSKIAAAQTHYPLRHMRDFNALFCDGHVTSMTQAELHDSLFYAYGP